MKILSPPPPPQPLPISNWVEVNRLGLPKMLSSSHVFYSVRKLKTYIKSCTLFILHQSSGSWMLYLSQVHQSPSPIRNRGVATQGNIVKNSPAIHGHHSSQPLQKLIGPGESIVRQPNQNSLLIHIWRFFTNRTSASQSFRRILPSL